MGSITGPAKLLGAGFIVGAVLMAAVALGIGPEWPFRIDSGDLPIVYAVLGAWFVMYLVLALIAVADATRLTRRGDLGAAQESANFVKLVAVPYFLLNFVALTEVVAIVGVNDRDRLGLDGFLVAVLFVILTYVVLLPTSAYGVACLLLMKRNDQIGRIFFGLNLVLQFLFVVDVPSTIAVVEVARDRLGATRRAGTLSRNLLAGVLIAGSSVAVVWLACVAIFWLLDPPGTFVRDAIYVLTIASPVEFVLLVLVPVVPLATFRTAVRLLLTDDLDALRRSARIVKLALIPLFVQNFVLCAIAVLATTFLPIVATRGTLILLGPGALVFLGAFGTTGLVWAVITTYLMMLPTSVYGLTMLALLMRHRAITPRFCALHAVLHLVFVADIVSTLVVAHRARQLMAAPSPALQADPAVVRG
ncbi:hypothetical protein [Kribbella sp. NPDC000426]|uniref:hypothetical protein n=1 Tax=Kribbella sp. NPDC000426 TaxID=3154255 RepID=UPI00332E3DBC